MPIGSGRPDDNMRETRTASGGAARSLILRYTYACVAPNRVATAWLAISCPAVTTPTERAVGGESTADGMTMTWGRAGIIPSRATPEFQIGDGTRAHFE